MNAVLKSAQELFLDFSAKASNVFSFYDSNVIQRRKKNSSNIGARYICQFTIELLNRQAGGYRGTADRLAELLGKDVLLSYSASSICEARKKFPSQIFLDLNKILLDKTSSLQEGLWFGRRLFAIDGSKIVLPKNLEKSGFKAERKESHYPMGRLSCLYQVGTQFIHDISLQSHCNERRSALDHFDKLASGDITVYDRGYFSFNLLAAHRAAHHDFVMRFSESTGISAFEDFIQKNKTQDSADKIVKISPVGANTKKKIARDFPSENQEFSVRLIKYTHAGKPYYLVTSIDDKKVYPRKVFADLYHSRWGVEEAYKQLKVFLLKKEFHSNCYQTVCQEIYASVLVINMSRALTFLIEIEKSAPKKKSEDAATQDFEVASKQVIRLLSNENLRNISLYKSDKEDDNFENRSCYKEDKSPPTERTKASVVSKRA